MRKINVVLIIMIGTMMISGCGIETLSNAIFNNSYSTKEMAEMTEEYEPEKRYIYPTLTPHEKEIYGSLLYCIMKREDEIKLDASVEMIGQIYSFIRRDYGEIFWVNGYEYEETNNRIIFKPSYVFTDAEIADYQNVIETSAEEIMKHVDDKESDYEKVKAVYEYLAENIDYNEDVRNDQSILSVFLDRNAVCWGYASAAQYLLYLKGVQSEIVTGTTANGLSHAWNIVKIDGEWYHFDVTFAEGYTKTGEINYKYMTMTDDMAYSERDADGTYVVPDCDSYENNYYNQEGLLFETVEENNLFKYIEEESIAGAQSLTVCFEDVEELDEIDLEFYQHVSEITGETEVTGKRDFDYHLLTLEFGETGEGK